MMTSQDQALDNIGGAGFGIATPVQEQQQQHQQCMTRVWPVTPPSPLLPHADGANPIITSLSLEIALYHPLYADNGVQFMLMSPHSTGRPLPIHCQLLGRLDTARP